MGWDEVPVVLTVSLSCPGGPDPVGTVKTISASTNIPATITFLVNEASKTFENTNNAAIEVAQLNGGLTISVLATYQGISDVKRCIWAASPLPQPLVITAVDPSANNINDTMGTVRTFSASVNQPASLFFYFDGLLVESSPINITEWSYTSNPLPPGDHFVRVVAKNANGSDEYCWNWHSELIIIYEVVGHCIDPKPNCGLTLDAYYREMRYPGQFSEMIVKPAIDVCLNCSAEGGFYLLYSITSLNIVISWPGGSIERNLEYGIGSIRDNISFSIPKADYYNITCSASTSCFGIQFAKQDGPGGELLPCIPLPMMYSAQASCTIRLPEQGNIP